MSDGAGRATIRSDQCLAASEPSTAMWPPDSAASEESLASLSPSQWITGQFEGPSGLPALNIPGFSILGELGRGGMGVVYKAWQVSLNRLVALKMIRNGALARPEELTRFRLEAEAVALLQHPNVVQIHEIGEQAGQPYFALEFVSGGSLGHKLNRTPQAVRQAAQLIEVLARAIHYAHERGIVHRDLKPENVLLTEDGTPKITDFGLAKWLAKEDLTGSGCAVMGTPSYMAPEQAEGKSREVGPTADIYALGAILYEMLTGRPPFTGESYIDILLQVRFGELVAPSRLQPKVPHDLETICLACLQKEPHQRYSSALALAEDLRRFLAGEPIWARPTPAWERALKWVKRQPTAAALVSVSVAALLSVATLLLWHQKTLASELAVAVAEAHRHRDDAQLARESQRVAVLRGEVQELILAGQAAQQRQEWQTAQLQVSRALDQIGTETALADLKARAEQLLAELTTRQALRDQVARFGQLRAEALFHATLLTGEERAVHVALTRKTTRDALARLGVSVEGQSLPDLGPSFSEGEKKEFRARCYELLMMLAEAENCTLPGQQPAAQAVGALRLLDRAATFNPPTRGFHLRRARYLSQCGDEASAAAARAQADACPPTNAIDHYLAGEEEYRGGRLDRAVDHLDRALDVQADHFGARLLRAVCHLRMRSWVQAHAGLTVCLGQQPDFRWLCVLRGFASAELELFKDAESDFQKALQGAPDKAVRYGIHTHRGLMRLHQGNLPGAASELQEATRLRPDQHQAYVNLAQVYQAQKQFGEAVRVLDEAIALQPRLASLYRARAQIHLQRQALDAALDDFEEAICQGPALADDHLERGRILYRKGMHAEALQASRDALSIRAGQPLALRLCAEALLELHRYAEALEAFDRYLERGEPLATVWRGRALARSKLNDGRGAIEDYTLALKMAPDSVTHVRRGWAHLACDSPTLALRDFQDAIQLDADNGEAYCGRGLAHVHRGQTALGVADAVTGLRRGPETASLLYSAARVYAQAVDRVEPGANPRTRGEYLAESLRLIGKALDKVPSDQQAAFWREHVATDSVLNPIRRPGASELARLAQRALHRAGDRAE